MNEDSEQKRSLIELLRVQHWTFALMTLIIGLVGAGLFALIHSIDMPFVMVSLFKFGLVPSLTVIALVGAIRGPLAGFLSGYFGILTYDLLVHNTIVTLTLPALAYGVLGFIVGLASYDFTKGSSLGKLSILSAVGLIFTGLLLVVVGLFVEQIAILAGIGFILLPLLTSGLPTVIFVTPIIARIWAILSTKIELPWNLS
ncbi:MAG: hypothetical protein ACFFEV_08155 [Candidatus Thorarchaeota archaeon]